MDKWVLRKEPIDKAVKSIGLTKTAVSIYVSKVINGKVDKNWLHNRLSPSRSTLVDFDELETLADLLKVDMFSISDAPPVKMNNMLDAPKSSAADMEKLLYELKVLNSNIKKILEAIK